LFATGALPITPYPAGGEGATLFDFDFTKPQLKVRSTGEIVQIGPANSSRCSSSTQTTASSTALV
jgi:hypothetical protein